MLPSSSPISERTAPIPVVPAWKDALHLPPDGCIAVSTDPQVHVPVPHLNSQDQRQPAITLDGVGATIARITTIRTALRDHLTRSSSDSVEAQVRVLEDEVVLDAELCGALVRV